MVVRTFRIRKIELEQYGRLQTHVVSGVNIQYRRKIIFECRNGSSFTATIFFTIVGGEPPAIEINGNLEMAVLNNNYDEFMNQIHTRRRGNLSYDDADIPNGFKISGEFRHHHH